MNTENLFTRVRAIIHHYNQTVGDASKEIDPVIFADRLRYETGMSAGALKTLTAEDIQVFGIKPIGVAREITDLLRNANKTGNSVLNVLYSKKTVERACEAVSKLSTLHGTNGNFFAGYPRLELKYEESREGRLFDFTYFNMFNMPLRDVPGMITETGMSPATESLYLLFIGTMLADGREPEEKLTTLPYKVIRSPVYNSTSHQSSSSSVRYPDMTPGECVGSTRSTEHIVFESRRCWGTEKDEWVVTSTTILHDSAVHVRSDEDVIGMASRGSYFRQEKKGTLTHHTATITHGGEMMCSERLVCLTYTEL